MDSATNLFTHFYTGATMIEDIAPITQHIDVVYWDSSELCTAKPASPDSGINNATAAAKPRPANAHSIRYLRTAQRRHVATMAYYAPPAHWQTVKPASMMRDSA